VTTIDTQDQTPVNLTNIHLGYQDGPWETDAFAYYNTRFKEPEQGTDVTVPVPMVTIPAHISLSGRVGYKINDKMTAAVSGQELQTKQAVTSTGLETERRVFISLDSAF
jgi:iron complex outermembrane receptor protein